MDGDRINVTVGGQSYAFPEDATPEEVQAFLPHATSADIQRAFASVPKATADPSRKAFNPFTGAKPGVTQPGKAEEPKDPSSVVGGIGSELWALPSALYHTFADPARPGEPTPGPLGEAGLPIWRMAHGQIEGSKEALGQAKDQASQAILNAKKGDLYGTELRGMQALISGASAFNPFATGSVVTANKLGAQGLNKEAMGRGIVDILANLLGKKLGSEPGTETQLGKLRVSTSAVPEDLRRVLPELNIQSKISGLPTTVGGLRDMVQGALKRLDNRFNQGIFRFGSNPIVPTEIADALRKKALEMPQSPDAQAIANQLWDEAVNYERPWDIKGLNEERMYRNGLNRGFSGKADLAQMAALRSDFQMIRDQIVANGTRDILYDYLDRRMPGLGAQALKQTEGSMMEILDKMKKHIDNLEGAHYEQKGTPLSAKSTVSLSAYPGERAMVPRFHSLQKLIPGRTALGAANQAASTAFGPTGRALARQSAVLSMPVSVLATSAAISDAKKALNDMRVGPAGGAGGDF